MIAQAYVEDKVLPTRRVEDLVEAMGIAGISKSEVPGWLASSTPRWPSSVNARWTLARYLWIDTLTQKVHEAGRVNVSAVVATAVNIEGRREIVGFRHRHHEVLDGVPAVPRGDQGVELVISDAHGRQSGDRGGVGRSVVAAVSNALHGQLGDQASWPMIAMLVRSTFGQPDRDSTWSQLGDVVDRLTQPGPCDLADDVFDAADSSWPSALSRRALGRDPLQQPTGTPTRDPPAHRRRGGLRHRPAVIRLVGALLAEQTDEWAIARRYMSADSLAKPRHREHSPADPQPRSKPPPADRHAALPAPPHRAASVNTRTPSTQIH